MEDFHRSLEKDDEKTEVFLRFFDCRYYYTMFKNTKMVNVPVHNECINILKFQIQVGLTLTD